MSTKYALIWSYAGTGTKIVCQFVLTIALARILGPDPYGLMAIALLPIGLGSLVADAGLGSGLIQRRVIDNELIVQCMWWQMAIGMVLGFIVLVISAPLAHVLGGDRALPYMLVVAIIFPINAMSQVPSALLRRDMRFKEVQISSVSSMVIGNAIIGLTLALLGAGPWALVAASIAQSLVNTLMLWRSAKPPWAWRRQAWPSALSSFSINIIGLNIASWFITNSETMSLSRLMGVSALGTYGRMTTLTTGLVSMLIPPLQSVLMAHHSRQQHNMPLIRRQWLKSLLGTFFFFLMIALPLIFFPGLVIAMTLGAKWSSHQGVLRSLAVAMVLNGAMCICGPILQAIGRPGREFIVQAVVACLSIPALFLAAGAGNLEVFAWVVAGLAGLRCLLVVVVTSRSLRAPGGAAAVDAAVVKPV